jgi:hypothetical protein
VRYAWTPFFSGATNQASGPANARSENFSFILRFRASGNFCGRNARSAQVEFAGRQIGPHGSSAIAGRLDLKTRKGMANGLAMPSPDPFYRSSGAIEKIIRRAD